MKRHITVNSPKILFLVLMFLSSSVQAQDLEKIEIKSTRALTGDEQNSLSVSSINASAIELQQAVHINELLSQAAGSWISRGNGQESLISLRSPVLTGAGSCGAFVVAEMGVPVRPMGFCNANQLFEINTEQAENIEIIRGPASSQYDGNAVHGVINSQPLSVFQQSPLSIGLLLGERHYQRSKFSLGQHNQQAGWLLYGNQSKESGYQIDSGYEQQKANFIYQQQQSNFDSTLLVSATHLNQQSAGFIQGKEAYKDNDLARQNDNPDAFRHANALRISTQLNWYQDNQQWSLTPYLRHSFMRFSQHWVPWQPIEVNQQTSAGMQSLWRQQWSNLTIATGLDFEYAQSELEEFQEHSFSSSIPQGFHYQYQVNSELVSAWAKSDWQLHPALNLNLSLRWSMLQYQYDNLLEDGSACNKDVELCRFYRPADTKAQFNHLSPRLALNYQIADTSNLYLALSKGYRPPQSSELFRLQQGQQLADLQAETLSNIELGYKHFAAFGKLQISLFDMHKNHYIFQDTERYNHSNGKTRHTGAEVETSVKLSEQISVDFNASYIRHIYSNNIQISDENIEGNDIDSAPRVLSQITFNWQPDSNINSHLSWLYLGSYYLEPQNKQTYPGHHLLNYALQYSTSNQLTWQLSVRNLLDTDYAERADFAFNQYRYFIGLPRTVYLGFSWQQH